MTKDLARQNELKPMALCEPCQGIQRNWRKAPGHAELVQRGNRKEDREDGTVTITRYVCDRCGTAWEYEPGRFEIARITNGISTRQKPRRAH